MNENSKVKKSQTISKHSLNTRLSDKQQKPRKSVTVINHNRRSINADINIACNVPIDTKLLQTKNCANEKYTKPELNTALMFSKRLDTLKNAPNEKLIDFNQMTPRTKTIATEKALKKLNFHPDQSTYKNLVPINVNDSVLDVKSSLMRQHSKSKTRVHAAAKDPEPILSHYLKPTRRLEHRLTLDDDDDDDDSGINCKEKSSNHFANNQFKRMYDFYEQYLCPISASMYNHCNSQDINKP